MNQDVQDAHRAHPLTAERLSELLEALDWEREELADIAADRAAGRLDAAFHGLAAFARRCLVSHAKALDLTEESRGIAEDAVEGRVTVVYIPHSFPDGEIDWRFDATSSQGLSHDNEWTWQLNRMNFWLPMASAFAATADARYACAYVRQLRGWVSAWERPEDSGNRPGSGWRTIECGLRLMSTWPKSMGIMARSSEVTDADVLLYLWSSLAQMRHLMAHHSSGSNWLTMEMNGVYTFAAMFPQFRESSEARRMAMTLLYDDLKRQMLPDGAQWELTPNYHVLSMDCSLSLIRAAVKGGFASEVPSDFPALLQGGYEYLVNLMTPDRMTPCFNDSGLKVYLPRCFSGLAEMFPRSRAIQWVASGAKADSPLAPEATSVYLPWSGRIILRSGWAEDAVYAAFDVGPLGHGHYHQDKLNLVLHAFGEELLFDDGGGNYEQSCFRSYACSAWGHSVVAVDGLGQWRDAVQDRGRLGHSAGAVFSGGDAADFAEAVYDEGFGLDMRPLAVHRRQVLFVKPDMVFVCDILTPRDDAEHHYEARWQVDARSMTEVLPDVFMSCREGANLVVAPLLSDGTSCRWCSEQVGTGGDSSMAGLFISLNPRPYRPAVTVSHERRGSGEQRFVTLLLPLRGGQSSPLERVTAEADGAFLVQLCDGRRVRVRMTADGLALDA